MLPPEKVLLASIGFLVKKIGYKNALSIDAAELQQFIDSNQCMRIVVQEPKLSGSRYVLRLARKRTTEKSASVTFKK